MKHNVGRKERIARLAVGAIAGAAAMRAHGWQRGALCGVSTSAFLTGLTRYCPLNAAMGIDNGARSRRISPHDDYVRNTAIRRETQTAGAMGQLPGTSVEPVRSN
jgi:Protein of unknown function (DUF2892)